MTRWAALATGGILLVGCSGGASDEGQVVTVAPAVTTAAPTTSAPPTTTTSPTTTTTVARTTTTPAPTTTTTTLPPYTEAEIKGALLPAARAWAADYNIDGIASPEADWGFVAPLVVLRSSGRWPQGLTIPDPVDGIPNDLTAVADETVEIASLPDGDILRRGFKSLTLPGMAEALTRWTGVPLVQVLYDGTHRVGQDVAPGTYVANHRVDGCYWERQDPTGNIIDNNFVGSALRVEVTVRASDFGFQSEDCGPWIRAA
jgi:hypothetical protein